MSVLERKLLEYLRRKHAMHDCQESGCSQDPYGKPIGPDNPGQRRTRWAPSYKRLWLDIRGRPLPEGA